MTNKDEVNKLKKHFEKQYATRISFAALGFAAFSTFFGIVAFITPSETFAPFDVPTKLTGTLAVIMGIMSLLSLRREVMVSGITKDHEVHSLISREDTEASFNGGFVLGTGTINGTAKRQEYYVYYRKGEYGIVKDKISTESTELIMTNDVEPSYKEVVVEGDLKKLLFVPEDTVQKHIEIRM